MNGNNESLIRKSNILVSWDLNFYLTSKIIWSQQDYSLEKILAPRQQKEDKILFGWNDVNHKNLYTKDQVKFDPSSLVGSNDVDDELYLKEFAIAQKPKEIYTTREETRNQPQI